MTYLYVTEQGATLRKTGERLLVTKQDETLLDVPCRDVAGVMLFGNIQFTTAAVRELMDHGVEMALLTLRGQLVCQLTPPTARNVLLRIAQYRHADDAAWSLAFAKEVVEAKIANSLALVRAHARNHPTVPLTSEIGDLERVRTRVSHITQAESLLGLEGTAAKTYFAGMAKMLRDDWGFSGRNRRPPRDPVNALLSFGYTLLFNEIASLLDGIGFDPYLGFFHQPDYGRPSLAADLVEEFRAPIVDRLTLRLVNKQVLSPDDFERNAASGAVHLTRAALKRYLLEWDRFVGKVEPSLVGEPMAEDSRGTPATDPATQPPDDTVAKESRVALPDAPAAPLTYRQRFREQAYALERALLKGTSYEPYRW